MRHSCGSCDASACSLDEGRHSFHRPFKVSTIRMRAHAGLRLDAYWAAWSQTDRCRCRCRCRCYCCIIIQRLLLFEAAPHADRVPTPAVARVLHTASHLCFVSVAVKRPRHALSVAVAHRLALERTGVRIRVVDHLARSDDVCAIDVSLVQHHSHRLSCAAFCWRRRGRRRRRRGRWGWDQGRCRPCVAAGYGGAGATASEEAHKLCVQRSLGLER